MRLDDLATSLEVIAEFPEIKSYYGGHGTAVNISVTASPASGKFLSFSKTDGFVVGREDDFYLTLELYCSNESQNRSSELCVIFDIKTNFWFNVTVQDWDLNFMITDAILETVEITKDNIGMKDRDYRRVLQHILNYGIANVNFVNCNPIPLNTTFALEPVIKEFVSITVTPFVEDEFLFIGFDSKSNVHAMLHGAKALAEAFIASQVPQESLWGKLFNSARTFLA